MEDKEKISSKEMLERDRSRDIDCPHRHTTIRVNPDTGVESKVCVDCGTELEVKDMEI